MLTVKEVKTRRDKKRFIQFQNDLYKDCPYYVPQSYNVRFRDAAMEIANRLEAALNRGGQAT